MHTQLNVCEKEELPCFLYLIQIFDCYLFFGYIILDLASVVCAMLYFLAKYMQFVRHECMIHVLSHAKINMLVLKIQNEKKQTRCSLTRRAIGRFENL